MSVLLDAILLVLRIYTRSRSQCRVRSLPSIHHDLVERQKRPPRISIPNPGGFWSRFSRVKSEHRFGSGPGCECEKTSSDGYTKVQTTSLFNSYYRSISKYLRIIIGIYILLRLSGERDESPVFSLLSKMLSHDNRQMPSHRALT